MMRDAVSKDGRALRCRSFVTIERLTPNGEVSSSSFKSRAVMNSWSVILQYVHMMHVHVKHICACHAVAESGRR